MSAEDPGAHLLQLSVWVGEAQVPSQGEGCLSHLRGHPAFSWAPGTPTPRMSALPLCGLLWKRRLTVLQSLPWPHILQLPPQLVSSMSRLCGSCATSCPLLWDTCPRPASWASARCRSVSYPPVARMLWHTTLYGRYISITKQRGEAGLSQGSHCRFLLGKCIRITSGAILFRWPL